MQAGDVQVPHHEARRAAHHLRAVPRGNHLADLAADAGSTGQSRGGVGLGAGEGGHAGGEVVGGHGDDGVFVLVGEHGGRGAVGLRRVERLGERSADRRAVLAEAHQRRGEAREVRAGAQDLHHGLGLRLAVQRHRAVEQEVPAVLVVRLHEVHQLHVGGVAPQLVAEDPRDQRDLVRGQRDGPRTADLRSSAALPPTRSIAVSPSPRTSISCTSSGSADVAKDCSGASYTDSVISSCRIAVR